MIGRPLKSIALCVMVIVIAGCATVDVIASKVAGAVLKPKATTIQANLEASPDLNPDLNGRPSPVKIRLYVLKSLSVFENTDFFALRERDRELLAEDIAYREEMHVRPARTHEITYTIKAEDSPEGPLYVGVMAAYRDLENAEWRAATEIQSKKTTALTVYLDRLSVDIQKKE